VSQHFFRYCSFRKSFYLWNLRPAWIPAHRADYVSRMSGIRVDKITLHSDIERFLPDSWYTVFGFLLEFGFSRRSNCMTSRKQGSKVSFQIRRIFRDLQRYSSALF
jgi:hypothetical protein